MVRKVLAQRGMTGEAANVGKAAPKLAHSRHTVLDLQRQAGNRAVTAMLLDAGRLRPPAIQRFGELEHKTLGDTGSGKAMINLPGGIAVTFGDITALAGDYFGSAAQIRTLASKPGNNRTPGTVDEVNFALHVKIRGDQKQTDFAPEVADAVTARFYALAGTNLTHFTEPGAGDTRRSTDELAKARGVVPDSAAAAYGVARGTRVPVTNVGSYRANHEKALEVAAQAGAGGPATMDEAMLYEAFASHFLTDAYAAGHLRTPRAAVGDWWNPKVPMFWMNLQLWMAEVIAQHLNDHSVAGYLQTVQQLYEAAQQTLRNVTAKMPELTFGDAVSGALHDTDNDLGVDARVGADVVKLVGDGQVIDGAGRALVKGVPTAEKAAAGVKASLQEVRNAFTAGSKGTAPGAAIAAIRLSDGLFRAEQLWPRALADSDPQQTNPSRKWRVAGVEDLFSDARMRAALTHFAHEKADTLGSEVTLDPPFRADKMLALKEAVLDKLKGSESTVIGVLRAVVNYTPGSATGQVGGIGGHDMDDDALTYYLAAKSKKGALETLTLTQRKRLVRAGLEGSTTGAEDTMVADLLTSATRADSTAVLTYVGWRWVWDDLSGNDLRRVVDVAGQSFWATQPLPRKKAEISFLASGRTSEISQRAIVMILRTCTPAEVRDIDKALGWPGLDFDLEGSYQTEFDRLKRETVPRTP